ncbi:MAG: hypothetical protein EYC70_16595 [Planctomycetota bacterium]|nr:MAG: hypothetical protein EYC70_16595 [Planctomycetota bacterium]
MNLTYLCSVTLSLGCQAQGVPQDPGLEAQLARLEAQAAQLEAILAELEAKHSVEAGQVKRAEVHAGAVQGATESCTEGQDLAAFYRDAGAAAEAFAEDSAVWHALAGAGVPGRWTDEWTADWIEGCKCGGCGAGGPAACEKCKEHCQAAGQDVRARVLELGGGDGDRCKGCAPMALSVGPGGRLVLPGGRGGQVIRLRGLAGAGAGQDDDCKGCAPMAMALDGHRGALALSGARGEHVLRLRARAAAGAEDDCDGCATAPHAAAAPRATLQAVPAPAAQPRMRSAAPGGAGDAALERQLDQLEERLARIESLLLHSKPY